MHSRTQKKKKTNDDLRLDELKQYDRQQNLELEEIPCTESENMTQTVIDLTAFTGRTSE